MSYKPRLKLKVTNNGHPRDVATFRAANRYWRDATDYFTPSTDMVREGVISITAGQHLAYRFDGQYFSSCPCHEQW